MDYILKYRPEDFIVEEISNVRVLDKGQYLLCTLKKTDFDQQKALKSIAERLNIPLKNIGFAGTKDKKAITRQVISIKNISRDKIEQLKLRDIELEFLGYSDQPVNLGFLEGNRFRIVVRQLLNNFELPKVSGNILFPNYFGEQRFSKNNVLIGRYIIKGDLKAACDTIIEADSQADMLKDFLEARKNDYAGALKNAIPLKTLKMYIHSVQSYIFNEALARYLRDNLKVNEYLEQESSCGKLVYPKSKTIEKISKKLKTVPILGFGSELKDDVISKQVSQIAGELEITDREFIIRKMPEISSEGSERDAFCEMKKISASIDSDEAFPGMKKLTITFELQKASYATVAIDSFLCSLD